MTFESNENVLLVSGTIDAQGAVELVSEIEKRGTSVLDFSKVEEVKFAALRALLRFRQNGFHFEIINACPAVIERFEDSGVSSFINITRELKPLDLSKYSEFGAGYLSKAFNSEDGDSMLKVYTERVPRELAVQERNIARAVMRFGLPTPLAGSIYADGDNTGIDFERIEGKRSFSRIISEEPQRMEEITVRFAKMCKKLHSTPCDTNIFSDRAEFYRKAVKNSKDLTADEKSKVLAFIDNVPARTTCLHGDMQLSNVITNGIDDLWIDLSDFGYGNPLLDMGMWYFLSKLNSEKLCLHVFHLTKAQMSRVWDIFSAEYFGADNPEKRAALEREVEPFAALHMLYLGSTYGFEPGMLDYIRRVLLS